MTTTIGNITLSVGVLLAAATLLVSLAAVRLGSQRLARTARGGVHLLTLLLTVASALLMTAMLTSDFSLSYVGRYTERALPTGYKAAAFWAGQEGSLLLWAWLLAAMASLFAFTQRKDTGRGHPAAVGTLAAVVGFFTALMLFAANPFATVDPIPADGRGLNPMLQDPGMLSHPPILFLGYAGYTIPFALMVGALITRRLDSKWIDLARPWSLVSWIFLGVGIILGAQWAYVELGWGGYWAWDPVENASLLPWLTGTALLHSILAHKQRGVFKRWAAMLAAFTFILCIFGTWITRSGVVDSVHTFGKSLVGTFFGVFLIVTTLFTIALAIWRWNAMKPERETASLLSREGAFLAGNILLVGMMLIVLVGTMFPAISQAIAGQPLTVAPSFYNKAALPLALGVVALMALAPILNYGKVAVDRLMNGLGLPLIVAASAVAALWVLNIRSAWALASAALAAIVLVTAGADIFRAVRARHVATGESLLAAAVHVLAANHRRYGAQIVHVGLVLMVVGIAGSSLYNTNDTVQLTPGQWAQVGKYNIRLDTLKKNRSGHYTAVQAEVLLSRHDGTVDLLKPERRFYDKAENPSSEVALRSTLKEDLYVTLAGWDERVVTLQVIVMPLVKWIWVGGVLLTLGAVVCLLPVPARRRQEAEATEPAVAAEPHRDRPRRKNRQPAVAVAH